MILNIFSCAYRPFVCLLWRNVFSISLHIYKLSCWSFSYVVRVLYTSWILNPVRYIICKYVHLVYRLPFDSLYSVLFCTKVLNFNELPFTYFFFCLCFWCHLRNPCQFQGHVDLPLCFPL